MSALAAAAVLPSAPLAAGVLGTLSLGLLRRPPAAALRVLALAAVAAALALALGAPSASPSPLLRSDLLGAAWQAVIAAGALPLALWLDGSDDAMTALFLGSTLGMTLLATAANLPMLFIALEFMSLPAYLLVARSRPGSRGLEAALKYFFAGGLAGGLFMLGLSLYYADARTFGAAGALSPVGRAGAALMACAALFKLGAVPLHWWLPDVYEAAAPEVAGFLSTAMKSAAVLFLMRLCALAPEAGFESALPALGAVTALAGAAMALRQERLQRLLAYSSISHAGLLILGVGAWARQGRPREGAVALLFYLATYVFLSNGSFGFLKLSGARTRAELKGLGPALPLASVAFTALLLALGGVPPTGGFLAKLLVLWRAVDAGLGWPAAVAGLAALVSLGYYLGLVRDLWFEAPRGPAPRAGARGLALVCACGAAGVALGAAPWLLSALGVAP